MTSHITPEIEAAYASYLLEPVDFDFFGTPILRRSTYPYLDDAGLLLATFAAGYQAAANSAPKDHAIAQVVNKLTAVAQEFHGHQSLRQRISQEVRVMHSRQVLAPALNRGALFPSTGPVSGTLIAG